MYIKHYFGHWMKNKQTSKNVASLHGNSSHEDYYRSLQNYLTCQKINLCSWKSKNDTAILPGSNGNGFESR